MRFICQDSRTRIAAGHVLAVTVAAAIAVLLFLYRFNALGGSLGGFENDEFAHLMRTEMILRGQQPLRDFVDFELRGAWPSLSYQIPAWAQQIWGRNLLAEAYLAVGSLAVCTGAAFLLARHVSRQWVVALAAAAAVFVSGPKPYNYSKVLVLTLAVASMIPLAANPSMMRLAVVAVCTAIATLYRHDYGVYVGLAATATIVARQVRPWETPLRRVSAYVGLTALCLLPSAAWVQRYEGLASYLANNLASAANETRTRNLHEWPAIDPGALLDERSLMAFVYYACWAMPIAAAMVVVFRWRAFDVRAAAHRGLGGGLVTLGVAVNIFFLRSNLDSRFGDAMVAVVLAAAWIAGSSAIFTSRAARVAVRTAPTLALLLVTLALVRVNLIGREFGTAGITVSPAAVRDRFVSVRAELTGLPPLAWSDHEAQGTLKAARYLAECTTPVDHVIVGDYAGEVPVYARRPFAGGQATVSLGFYRSEADQRRFLGRLARQSVPIVLTAADYHEGFAIDYPLIAGHLANRYRRAGTIEVEGRPRFLVFVEGSRVPTGTHLPLGLPCFR